MLAQRHHPSLKVLAEHMGLSDKRVREIAKGLEDKGYLKRYPRKSKTNKFDLDPLLRALEKHAFARLGVVQAPSFRRRTENCSREPQSNEALRSIRTLYSRRAR